MAKEFDPEFGAIRAALVSKPELTKDLNVSIRNLLRLTEHLQNSGLRMERHGRWIDKSTGRYGQRQSWCSACGEHSGIGGIESNRHKPYCPVCGAKMDGGDGDD